MISIRKTEYWHFKNKYCIPYIFFIAFVILSNFVNAEYAPNLPNSKYLNEKVLELSLRYKIGLPASFYRQPLTYMDVTTFIDSIYIYEDTNSTDIKDFLSQFKHLYGTQKKYLSWQKQSEQKTVSLHLSLLGDISQGVSPEFTRARGIISPSLTGSVGSISFYSGINVWTDYQSDTSFIRSNYEPYNGIPYNLYGRSTQTSNIRSSDVPRGGIKITRPNISIETAIDYLRQGPANHFPLTFSGTTPPITYGRGVLDLSILEYSHTVGILRHQKDKDKFLYTHRLNSKLFQNKLNFGLSEVIIYGSTTERSDTIGGQALRPEFKNVNRTWEWVYLIPFVPFKFVEHYAGDRDNAAISFDLDYSFLKSTRVYMEFFLDDMLSPWKIFTDDWGNKWALTIGVQTLLPLQKKYINLNVEYSRVEPWVYTHFNGGSHRYTHFGQSIGSVYGPNSQAFTIDMSSCINPQVKCGINLLTFAKNSSVRGGKITDIFQDTIRGGVFQDSERKTFLGKGTEFTTIPSIYGQYNVWGTFFMDCKIGLKIDEKVNPTILAFGGLQF